MIRFRNIFIIFVFIFLLLNFLYDFKNIRNLFNSNQENIISNFIFPQKNINELELQISKIKKERNTLEAQKKLFEKSFKELFEEITYLGSVEEKLENLLIQMDPYEFDMHIKTKNSDLEYSFNSKQSFISNNLTIDIYNPTKNILMYGIANQFPASGFIDQHNNNLILLSASGVLTYAKELIVNRDDNFIFKQIKTNIDRFINEDQFSKSRMHDFDWLEGGWFSIKDIHIDKEEIYVSYTREVKDNCWNTSMLQGSMNYQYIEFDILFTSDECVHTQDNIDEEFNAHQSGGRIVSLDDTTLLLSTGDFRSRHRVQNLNSIFGKIIKINKMNKNYSIISMGHRNPQGLYYNKKLNYLLEAEHGPEGGDEINFIDLNKDDVPNYGWAISSYGEHYGGKFASYNKKKYIKYPLHKSHEEHGYIEPVKYFDPSIGISQIVGLNKNNQYAVASLKDSSVYFFELKNNKELTNLKRENIGERIRDMIKIEDGLVLFLEDTASIAFIDLK